MQAQKSSGSRHIRNDFAPDVVQQAVEWILALQDAQQPQKIRADIANWCAASPEHLQAWQQVEQLSGHFGLLANPEHAQLAQDTLTATSPSRRTVLKGFSAILITSSVAYVSQESGLIRQWQSDIHTATGEQRRLTLNNGTTVVLNSNTAIQLDDSHSTLSLLEGEIHVSSKANDDEPISLLSPNGRIQLAPGSRLALRLFKDNCRLAVYEGEARLRPAQASNSCLISAGQATRFTAHEWFPLTAVRQDEAAWIDGMIVVLDMPLAEFIAELQRYRPGILRLDPSLAAYPVSGTYPISQTDQVLEALSDALPIRQRRLTRYWITLLPA